MEDLSTLQKNLTNLALKIASANNVELDFSVESLGGVDKILSIIHEDYQSRKSEEGIRGIALEFAAYIATVIGKSSNPGRWERDSKEMGKDSFPYYFSNGKAIFPYTWCLKRIIDGSAESIEEKFKALVLG